MSIEEKSQNSFVVRTEPFRATHPLEHRPSLGTAYVYGIQSLDLIKIGVAKDVKSRLFQIRGHNPHGCEIVFKRLTIAPYVYEEKMHELLADHAVGREWFRVTLDQVKDASKIAAQHAKGLWRSLSQQYALDRVTELREKRIWETHHRHSDTHSTENGEKDQNVA